MPNPMERVARTAVRVGVFALFSLIPVEAFAQREAGPLRVEKAYDFQFSRPVDIDARVGQVHVTRVQFTNIGRGGGSVKDTIVGKIRGEEGTQTTIKATFVAENPTHEKTEVTFTLEFLDSEGKLIDRVTKSQDWEAEAADFSIERPILDYVVPMITKVRLRMTGKLD
jgi:hypothetical protein